MSAAKCRSVKARNCSKAILSLCSDVAEAMQSLLRLGYRLSGCHLCVFNFRGSSIRITKLQKKKKPAADYRDRTCDLYRLTILSLKHIFGVKISLSH